MHTKFIGRCIEKFEATSSSVRRCIPNFQSFNVPILQKEAKLNALHCMLMVLESRN